MTETTVETIRKLVDRIDKLEEANRKLRRANNLLISVIESASIKVNINIPEAKPND